jgi:PhnB protein
MTTTNQFQVQPYLFFDGRCEEALEFYRKAIGAEVTLLMRFKESPDPTMCPSVDTNKIMHGSFRVSDTTILVSDGRCQGQPKFEGFSLSLTLASETEGERVFAALASGGQVTMPLTTTFFASRFGMVADQFGVPWMIVVPPQS